MPKDLLGMKKKKSGINTGDGDTTPEQKARQMYESYKGKSEKEIEKDLMDAVRKQTASGNFDPESLEKFFATASPMLTSEQRTRMRQIIDMIKQSR